MGYLFENMEKIDIQAERKNTEREKRKADAAEKRAEDEKRKREKLEEESRCLKEMLEIMSKK